MCVCVFPVNFSNCSVVLARGGGGLQKCPTLLSKRRARRARSPYFGPLRASRCPVPQVERARSYLSTIVAVVHVLLDTNAALLFHFATTVPDAPIDATCAQYQGEWVGATLVCHSAWLGYCNIMCGYSRAGALAMLWKPVVLAGIVLASPGISWTAWYYAVFTLGMSLASIGMSIHMRLLDYKHFRLHATHAALKAEQRHQRHSTIVNHVVKNAMAEADAGISYLMLTQPQLYTTEVSLCLTPLSVSLPPRACPTSTWCSDRIYLVPKLIRYRVLEYTI